MIATPRAARERSVGQKSKLGHGSIRHSTRRLPAVRPQVRSPGGGGGVSKVRETRAAERAPARARSRPYQPLRSKSEASLGFVFYLS